MIKTNQGIFAVCIFIWMMSFLQLLINNKSHKCSLLGVRMKFSKIICTIYNFECLFFKGEVYNFYTDQ